jgi:hypothetical protein
MKRVILIQVLAVLILAFACEGPERLPAEPRIEFRALSQFDTIDPLLGNTVKAGKITFYFEDGDGDLGVDPPPTPGPEPSGNLFLKLYRKTDGVFELATPGDPLYPSEYRIPYLETGGQNKILKGTIDVTIMYILYNTPDTLYYDFWIKDRAGNESNTASTCIFVFGEDGNCVPQ